MKINMKSPGIKLMLIVALTLLLLIPTAFLMNLIHERSKRLQEATDEVSSKWGYAQAIAGPMLTVNGTITQKLEDKIAKVPAVETVLLPEQFNVRCDTKTETRKRGIYSIPVYTADVVIEGHFPAYRIEDIWKSEDHTDLTGVNLSVALCDNSGIVGRPKIVLNGEEYEASPGIPDKQLVSSVTRIQERSYGISGTGQYSKAHDISQGFQLDIDREMLEQPISFRVEMTLRGTDEIHVVAIGKESTLHVTSDWPHPSFTGTFIPAKHEITDIGFTADWAASEMNRSFPQKISGSQKISNADFGVRFIEPVRHYTKVERSVKYAILVIGLTFVAFFLGEIMLRSKIHPIQYLLIGFSLVLFYLLLLALSEYMAFAMSYIIATVATIVTIGLYSWGALKKLRLSVWITVILVIIYTLLYVLMNLEDYTLLVGSIALFVILSAIMFLTRKIDWYDIRSRNDM